MSLWNFTLDDTSPFFTYSPYADGSNSGLGNGWVLWYSNSGYLSSNGQGGSGTSYHRTSLNGASVTLSFYGTGVDLYGLANCTYDVLLDNAPYDLETIPSHMLASISNLTEATHTVTLKATPTTAAEQVVFNSAMVFTTLVDNQVPEEVFVDNTDTTTLKYSGDWSTSSAPGIPNATVSHPWQETFSSGASVSMDIGVGAVGVSMWGMANWGNWIYGVSIDGGPQTTYNGSTFWKVPDALLYYQGGLDPTKNHTVTLTNKTPQMKLALNSIRVYKIDNAGAAAPSGSAVPDSSSSTAGPGPSVSSSASPGKHSSINAGAIAGPVVAVLLLGLVGALFLWRRSRRNRARSFSKPVPDMSQENLYTDQPPHRPTFPFSNNSSAVALNSPAPETASMYSTQISGPPGATVMTWGYHDSVSDSTSASTPSRLMVSNSATSGDGMSGHGHQLGEKAPIPLVPVGVTAPVNQSAGPTAATPATQNAPDIDTIIELIAQRIDRGRGSEVADGAAPPEYRG